MSQAIAAADDLLPGDLTRMRSNYRPAAVMAGTLAVMFLLALAAVMMANQGHFTYSLDQATYTHLAVAQQILNGGYGVFPGEPSAPSSSIVFPYLIAGLSWLGFGQLAPLAINIASLLALAPVLCGIAAECGWRLDKMPATRLTALTVALSLGLNFVGLAFTGLEHPLHILLMAICQWGLLRFLRSNTTDWWWLAAMIALPLVRYEAVAAVFAEVVILLLFRKFRYAAVVAIVSSTLVVSFSLYLHSLGMSYLPTSVLFNSAVATSSLNLGENGLLVFARTVATSLRDNVLSFGATHILVLLIIVCWSLHGWKRKPAGQATDWITPTAVMFCVIETMAQLCGGSLQSRSARYETYILFLEICTLLICYRHKVASFASDMSARRFAFVCLSIIVFGMGYVIHTIDLPGASKLVYSGPYQIRRFVVDYYKQPIASSRYGLINNSNPHHVLDLSGRISEAARLGVMSDSDLRWMERLVREHQVGLVILYPDDKAFVPADWVRVGKLQAKDTSVFLPNILATFYATDARQKEKIAAQLKGFGTTLPPGTSLSVF